MFGFDSKIQSTHRKLSKDQLKRHEWHPSDAGSMGGPVVHGSLAAYFDEYDPISARWVAFCQYSFSCMTGVGRYVRKSSRQTKVNGYYAE